MKTCIKCLLNQDISNYYKDKRIKDGYRNKCKYCVRSENKNWRSDNTEKVKESNKNWSSDNKEIIRKYDKKYRNTEKRKKYLNQWYYINSEYNKKYYENNKEQLYENSKLYNTKWMMDNKEYMREYHRLYNSKRRKNPLFKLHNNIHNSIKKALKRNGFGKKSKSIDILGCSIEYFKLYLESKFEPWMNWDNHGLYNGCLNYGWDIDHIIPVSSALNEEEIIKLNHFKNLQPLCGYVNRHIKGDKLNYLTK